MAIFYLSSDPSDLSNLGIANHKVNCTPGVNSVRPLYYTIPNGDNDWRNGYYYTEPFMLVKESWVDGSIDVHLGSPSSGAYSVTLVFQCNASRINSLGQVQETTQWSNEVSTTGDSQSALLTIPSYTWNHLTIQDSDRLLINWRVKCTVFNGTNSVKASTTMWTNGSRHVIDLPFDLSHIDHFINYNNEAYNYLTTDLDSQIALFRSSQSSHVTHLDALWNRYLKPSVEATEQFVLNLPAGDTVWYDAYEYTPVGYLRKSQWTNRLFTIELRVVSMNNNIEVKARTARVDKDGVVQEQTDWGATTPINTNGSLSISPGLTSTYEWDFSNILDSDLYMIHYQFRNLSPNKSESATFNLAEVDSTGNLRNSEWGPKPIGAPEVIMGTPEPILPTGAIIEASLGEKGDFDLIEDSFEGYFSYAKGTLLTVPTDIDIYKFNLSPMTDYPSEWGTYHQAVVNRVVIYSNIRGTIYDKTDTNSTLRIKDKTSDLLTLYPGEELTVGINYSGTGILVAYIYWGNSFIGNRTPEYIGVNHAQQKEVIESGLTYFDTPWVVPEYAQEGHHLLYFRSGGTGPVPQTWIISGWVGEKSAKLDAGEWYQDTTPEVIGVSESFEQTVPLEVNTNYLVSPSLHIYTDSVYRYSHRPTPNQVYIYPVADVSLIIKDAYLSLLGSINIIDKFTTENWEENTSSSLIVENHTLKLPGGN